MKIDLTGKRAFVAGVSDDAGYGFAIAKAMAEAGASVTVGTWPPALGIFTRMLARGDFEESLQLQVGGAMAFEKIYPLDAAYDSMEDVPEEVRTHRRYEKAGDFTIEGVTSSLVEDFGKKPLDIVVHSLAMAPEIKSSLMNTSRKGYLAALSVSTYSLISMVKRFGAIMRPGGSFLSLSYMASEKVIPGYGGGMSSAKAALESDTRVLAFEAGRAHGFRVNAISAGPLRSRAATAIGTIEKMTSHVSANAPLPQHLTAEEVANVAAFLASPLATGITGEVVHVDKGYSTMGMPAEE